MNSKIVKNFIIIIVFSVLTFNAFSAEVVKVNLTNGTLVSIAVKVQHSDLNLKSDSSHLIQQPMEEILAGETKSVDLLVHRKTAYILASDLRGTDCVKLDSMRYKIPNNANNLIFKLNEEKNCPVLVENVEFKAFESEDLNQEGFEIKENREVPVKNIDLESSENINTKYSELKTDNKNKNKIKKSSLFSIKNLLKLGSAGALGYICYKIYNSQYKQDSSEPKK